MTISEATQAQLDEVMRWLKQEHDELLEGFYCNKSTITSSFAARQMYCMLRGGHVVGFGIFKIKSAAIGSIDILEIHPKQRRNGYGKKLAIHLVNHLFHSGADRVSVKCAPRSSESFWRKLGFVSQRSELEQFRPMELWLHKGAA